MSSWVLHFFVFALGCCLGSFLNVCIYRLPLSLSIVAPRSFCPHCQAPIRAYDNIPLLSYLLLRGKCRNCQGKIFWRYPMVEALTGGVTLALFLKFGFPLPFFSFLMFSAALLVITFIDLDLRIIPDIISLPGIAIGLLLALLGISITIKESLIGILAGGGTLFVVAFVYEAVTKREGMGGGDVKLLAMIGAWLGWQAILFTLFLASLSGTLIGGGAMLIQKEGRHYAIPFGPFLAFSSLAYVFFGPQLIGWYLGWGRP
ncbi:MAG: prepilin peptidase [Deltaproteobacteria bacterium]|nr:prepilin peptidase [Deltaproteobacteria bacterium]